MYSAFKQGNHVVLGLANSRSNDELRKLDLLDQPEVEKVFKEFAPNCEFISLLTNELSLTRVPFEGVIHCAAERRPDVAEKVP